MTTLSKIRVGELDVYQSMPSDPPNISINQVVVVCHGLTDKPTTARQTGITMSEGNATTTVVLAPHFVTHGWAEVTAATLNGLNAVFDHATSQYPGAKLVLAGFSAGRQLVQRYCMAGEYASKLDRIIFGAPSTYAYFTDFRPFPPGPSCSGFNSWKYGFDGVEDATETSMTQVSANLEHYLQTPVHMMVGSLDNNPDFKALDKSCAAEAQGDSHMSRMSAYFDYVKNQGATAHTYEVVPDVGHSLPGVLGTYSLPTI